MQTRTSAPTPTILPGQFADPEAAAALHERNRRIAAENDNAVFGERMRRGAELRREYDRGHDDGYNACLQESHVSGFNWGFICGAVLTSMASALIIVARNPLHDIAVALFGF